MKKTRTLKVLIAALAVGGAFLVRFALAAWVDTTPSGAWHAVASSSDGAHVVAAMESGGIYTSSDYGVDWTIRTAAGSREWQGMAISSDGTQVAAAVAGGYIYTSSDSGATWTTNANASGIRNWVGLAGSSDGTHLAAVVLGGTVYTSADSGATWSDHAGASGSANWTAIASSSDGSHLIAGSTVSGAVKTSSDYGATWIISMGGLTGDWSAVASSSDGVRLMVAQAGGNVWYSEDSGGSWNIETGLSSQNWQGLAFSSDGTYMFVTAFGGDIWRSGDEGTTWTDVSSAGSRNWRAVTSSISGRHLVALDSAGDPWVSADYGVTWENSLASSWSAVASSADGTKLVAAKSGGPLYVSVDSGATWNAASSDIAAWTSVSSSADGTHLAAVADGGDIYVSTDSGASWANTTSGGSFSGLHFFSVASSALGDYLIAAENDGDIYTSNDNGATWTDMTSSDPSLHGKAWVSVASSSVGSHIFAAAASGDIYASANLGATWTNLTTGTALSGLNWASVASSADGTHLAAAYLGGVYVSADGGATWTDATSSTPLDGLDFISVALSSDGTHISAAARGNDTYTSMDGGASWADQVSLHDKPWTSIASSANGQKLVASDDGHLYTFAFLPPTVATGSASSVTETSATLNGGISLSGTSPVTARGFHYGTSLGYGNDTVPETGSFSTGSFSADISGLSCGTLYYFQAYAANASGSSTSAGSSFTTVPCPVVSGGGDPAGAVQVGLLAPSVTAPAGGTSSSAVPLSCSATMGAPYIFETTLLRGATGDEVSELQRFLDTHGFPLPADTGVYDASTISAVARFQEAHAADILAPQGKTAGNGVFGPATKIFANNILLNEFISSHADAIKACAPGAVAPADFEKTLAKPVTDPDVVRLETFLSTQGFPVTDASGTFGDALKATVARFQEAHFADILAPQGKTAGNGVFGPSTRQFANYTRAKDFVASLFK